MNKTKSLNSDYARVAFTKWLATSGYRSRKARHIKKFTKKFWKSSAGMSVMLRQMYEDFDMTSLVYAENPFFALLPKPSSDGVYILYPLRAQP